MERELIKADNDEQQGAGAEFQMSSAMREGRDQDKMDDDEQ